MTSIVIDSKLNNGLLTKRAKPFKMLLPSKLLSPKPIIFGNTILHHGFVDKNLSFRRRYTLQLTLPIPRFAKSSESIASSSPYLSSQLYSNPPENAEPSVSSNLTSSVGQPPLQISQWTLTQKHFVLLNVVACVVSLSLHLLGHTNLLLLSMSISNFNHPIVRSFDFDSNCSMKIFNFSICRQQFQHRGSSLLQFLLFWFVLQHFAFTEF